MSCQEALDVMLRNSQCHVGIKNFSTWRWEALNVTSGLRTSQRYIECVKNQGCKTSHQKRGAWSIQRHVEGQSRWQNERTFAVCMCKWSAVTWLVMDLRIYSFWGWEGFLRSLCSFMQIIIARKQLTEQWTWNQSSKRSWVKGCNWQGEWNQQQEMRTEINVSECTIGTWCSSGDLMCTERMATYCKVFGQSNSMLHL